MLQQLHEAGQSGPRGHEPRDCLQVPIAELLEEGSLGKVLEQVLSHWTEWGVAGPALQAGLQACQGFLDGQQSS